MMRRLQLFMLLLLTSFASIHGQADAAVRDAQFWPTSVRVGSHTNLKFAFLNASTGTIPAHSVKIVVQNPAAYFASSGESIPTGPGASLFDWSHASNDVWVGVNSSSIPAQGGGDIVLDVKAKAVTPTLQYASVGLEVIASFPSFADVASNNNLQVALQVAAAPLACAAPPTPRILGDFYGCSSAPLSVRVDSFFAARNYVWTINGGATVSPAANGNAVITLPNNATNSFVLQLVEESAADCAGVATAIIFRETNSSLSCDDNVRVSLGSGCSLMITPDMILEGTVYPAASYDIQITSGSTVIPNPVNGRNFIDKTVKVSIKHLCSGNSCWGTITFEDKVAPVITCPEPITISCFSTQTFLPPSATDNCDNAATVKLLNNEFTAGSCGSGLAGTRVISYQAEDDKFNKSEICTRYIYYRYEDLEDIEFPKNRDSLELPYFNCREIDTWDKNKNNYPDPAESGYPTLDGNTVHSDNGICKINAVYTDEVIPICANSYKILRKWDIIDWCTGEIIHDVQIIKVLDKEGPVVTCEPDFTGKVYTRPYECYADYPVPAPKVIYDCGITSYKVEYLLADVNGAPPANGVYSSVNVVLVNGSYVIKNLPKGLTWIKYLVSDACGNTTPCFTEVYVQDNVPPIAICDEFTVVSVTSNGYGDLLASTIDDGSYDNCANVHFEVARMTEGCNKSTNFGPSTLFCCDDIGKDTRAILRVWDDANCNGIYGDEIDVYNDANQNGIFGDQGDRLIRRVKDNSNTCMVVVKVQDKILPVIKCPANLTLNCTEKNDTAYTGSAVAFDNCPGVVVTLITNNNGLNNCWIGNISRTWRATDKSNNAATCTQTISVRNFNPFIEKYIDWNPVSDKDLTACTNASTDPTNTGRPKWSNDNCSLVTASYEDQVFHFVDDVCLKILRTWTVVDWCQYDPNVSLTFGKWTKIQVIKVVDKVPPTLTCPDKTVCIDGANCKGIVELTHEASDLCTPLNELKYRYTVDVDNNGTIDFTGGTSVIKREMSPGISKVTMDVEDGCGNNKTCNYILTVKDCKKPTPYCYTQLITVVMNNPLSKTVSIWARDFDKGSFDNCPGVLKYSFSQVAVDTGRTFGCGDLGIKTLKMYVTDAAGNFDYCEVKVNIQDNSGVCDGSGGKIVGHVKTQGDKNAPNVHVDLKNTSTSIEYMDVTESNGQYQFYALDPTQSYELSARKDDDILNGVSTLDLVMIQRHILGINKFTSPYTLIAADVNKNGSISVSDLVSLRKVILGVENKFQNNVPWRFVPSNYKFENPSQPFNFTEKVILNQNSFAGVDFVTVKVGDVNNSAVLSAQQKLAQPRSANPLSLVVEDQSYEANQIIEVAIKASQAYTMFGMQGAFAHNPNLKLKEVVAGKIGVNSDNYRIDDKGNMIFSISNDHTTALQKDDVLFTMIFSTNQSSTLGQSLSLTSENLVAEAYDVNLEAQPIDLATRSNEEIGDLIVNQNIPNPFVDETTITFTIDKDSKVSFEVYDISGKKLISRAATYSKGTHQIVLKSSELASGSAMLSYKITTDTKSITRKMLSLK